MGTQCGLQQTSGHQEIDCHWLFCNAVACLRSRRARSGGDTKGLEPASSFKMYSICLSARLDARALAPAFPGWKTSHVPTWSVRRTGLKSVSLREPRTSNQMLLFWALGSVCRERRLRVTASEEMALRVLA